MPRYQAVSNTEHQHKMWLRTSSYGFTRADAWAALAANEINRAAISYPLSFLKDNPDNPDNYIIGAILGVQTATNACLADDGTWRVDYVPAVFRPYPFALSTNPANNELVLGVDLDSDQIVDEGDELFFNADGTPSDAIKELMGFLVEVRKGISDNRMLCSLLDKCGVIVPWPLTLKYDDKEMAVNGLYKISEEKLRALPESDIKTLNEQGALGLAYAQLISMQNIQKIVQLAVAGSAQVVEPVKEIAFSEESLSGNISFDNFER